MQDKLQELTDRLYNEGLSKGKEEGERLLEEARGKAAAIESEARERAAQIINEARRKADEIKAKAESDVKAAAAQALQATRKDIENLLLDSACGSKVKSSLSEADFVKELIKAVALKFSAEESGDIALVLPEKMKDELEPWLGGELAKALDRGLKAEFSKKISGGFNIGPAEGGWYISLSDASFDALISEYMRPVTRKLLFGE